MSTPDRTNELPGIVLALLLAGLVASGVMVQVALANDSYSDFAVLHASGQAAWAGRPQYEMPAQLQHTGAYNLNPPHINFLVFGPLGLLPLRAAAIVMWGIIALSIAGTVALLRRVLPGWWPVAALAVVLPSAASYSSIRFINLAWPMAFAFTLAWLWMRREQSGKAGALLGILASAKLFLWLFLPYLAWRRQWRAVFAAVGMGLLMFGIGLLSGGADGIRAWLATLGLYAGHELEINASLYGVLTRSLSDTRDFAPLAVAPWLIRPLWVSASLALLAAMWWRFRAAARAESDREWASVLLASLLISPLGWVYYLPLAIGPAAVALRRTTGLSLTPATLLLVPHLVLTMGQPNRWLTVTLGCAYALGLLALWLRVVGANPENDDHTRTTCAP